MPGLLAQGEMLRELGVSLRQMAVDSSRPASSACRSAPSLGRSRLAGCASSPWVSMFVVTSTAALIPLFISSLAPGLMLRVTIVFLASVCTSR